MPPTTIGEEPAEPWRSFLSELDALLDRPGDFHCIGGFVISQYYGFARETADLDLLTVVPMEMAAIVSSLAGEGLPLHKKHRVYVDHVGVVSFPDNYETRLVRAFPSWSKARIWVLEAHDLALTKLERSNERDIRDVMFLAQAGLIKSGNACRPLRGRDAALPRRSNSNVGPDNAADVDRSLLAWAGSDTIISLQQRC
jgi:hypothetical protein